MSEIFNTKAVIRVEDAASPACEGKMMQLSAPVAIMSFFLSLCACACASAPAQLASPGAADDHPLAFMFGEWVGEASGVGPDRQPYRVTQTERVGTMLGGDVVVIEGRGYGDAGATVFNAMGVVSRASSGDGWEMRSYAQGRAGTFPFDVTENGFVWSTPAGPNARMRYTATVDGDVWAQIGEYVAEGRDPVQTFQMSLTRIGPTDWPAAGAVVPAQ